MSVLRATSLIGSLLFVLAACGSGGVTNAPAPTAAATTAATAAPSLAGGPAVAISGIDYSFQGIPATLKSGSTLTFRNDGAEVHEMVVMRRNEGVTKPFMAILSEGEAAARTQVTILGVSSALPGTAAPNSVTVDVKGDYALVCFIPTGTKPGTSSSAGGPPHFIQGMLAEFSVTD